MSRRMVPDSSQQCIWMSAGLLTYKLCDRGFQCDHCPLDAGLRGGSGRAHGCQSLQSPDCGTAEFPGDRCYTRGHAWIKSLESNQSRCWKFGLDAFAAAIIGHCGQIAWLASQGPFARGDPVCAIDFGLGCITIGAPLSCRKIEINPELLVHPDRLVAEPYDEGWIAALTMSDGDLADGFLSADAARETARLDLQWFRRQVALRLLADGEENANTPTGNVRQLVDLREMLAGPTYLKLLPELVH